MQDRETADEIDAAAARWVLRLDREGRTTRNLAALRRWTAADARRDGALLRAEAAWALLDRAAELDVEPEPAAPPLLRRRALIAGGLIAASAAGVGLLVLGSERYATAIGEIRRVPLKDGSTAAINTQSRVEVAMTQRNRVVKVARGEAWFQVAKNPERPFIVEAGRVRVRAVGTAFSVRRREAGADVLVTEGVVEAWTVGAEGHVVRIAAGGKAFVAENAAIDTQAAGPSEIDRELAWRAGKIDLAGETLDAAVADFNRYNGRKLVVADPALGEQRLYGLFRTDDPEGFARTVQQSLGGQLRLAPDEIRIGGE